MEKENLNGIMEKYFKVSGEMVKRMDLVFGNLQREIFIKDNGEIIDSMEKDTMCIKVDLNFEDILNNF